MSEFDLAGLAALMEPMVEKAVKAAVKAAMPGKNWEAWYKDLQTEMERESWKDREGFRYCRKCGNWEGNGHAKDCFWRTWTRDGKVEVWHG